LVGKPTVKYTPRLDATPKAELDALANVYRYILDCRAKTRVAELASDPDSSNDAAIVRNAEEVSHLEQRHDRSSQIT
jgi:hypothetical protein